MGTSTREKMSVEGDSLPQPTSKRCSKPHKQLAGKVVELSKTGDKITNILVAFLVCEAKTSTDQASCKGLVGEYEKCHKSIMGTGNYPTTGGRHCGQELLELLACIEGNNL